MSFRVKEDRVIASLNLSFSAISKMPFQTPDMSISNFSRIGFKQTFFYTFQLFQKRHFITCLLYGVCNNMIHPVIMNE